MRVSVFVLLGKFAGALKEMSIAYRYGISDVVDAYQLTFTLSTLLPTILLSAASIVLVPVLVGLRAQSNARQAKFLGELECVSVVLGVLLTLLLFVAWDPLMALIAGKLAAGTRAMSRELMFGMAPLGVLMLSMCVSAARLQARERHVNTLLECVPAATLLVFVLLWPAPHSAAPLMWGTTLGFVLQAVLLRVLAGRADGVRAARTRLRFAPGALSPEWRHMVRAVGVVMVGGLVGGLIPPLDQYFLGRFGDGAIATLGYANRVLALVLGMGALAISRATLPILSEMLARGDLHRARDTAIKWSCLMLVLGSAAVILPWLAAPWGIALLFERGAFTAHDTAAVASLFRWGLVQVPFYFAVLVLLQLFASEGRFREISAVAAAAFFIKALANLLLVRWFGIAGVFLATGAMHAGVLACYLALFWLRPAPPLSTDHRPVMRP